jgi:hypothetical protein
MLDQVPNVPGVSSPWLYVGGFFGSFCWHTEDLWMYSCNHLHAGATKTWYVVPATASSAFEKVTRSLIPSVFQDSPDLLYQLVAMVAPADLEAQGVPVYSLQQRAGEFIITFPRAYHAGFSHGFNVAEAVNFATSDWLPFGRNAVTCYSKHHRTPVFAMERLLMRLGLTPATISLSGESHHRAFTHTLPSWRPSLRALALVYVCPELLTVTCYNALPHLTDCPAVWPVLLLRRCRLVAARTQRCGPRRAAISRSVARRV